MWLNAVFMLLFSQCKYKHFFSYTILKLQKIITRFFTKFSIFKISYLIFSVLQFEIKEKVYQKLKSCDFCDKKFC